MLIIKSTKHKPSFIQLVVPLLALSLGTFAEIPNLHGSEELQPFENLHGINGTNPDFNAPSVVPNEPMPPVLESSEPLPQPPLQPAPPLAPPPPPPVQESPPPPPPTSPVPEQTLQVLPPQPKESLKPLEPSLELPYLIIFQQPSEKCAKELSSEEIKLMNDCMADMLQKATLCESNSNKTCLCQTLVETRATCYQYCIGKDVYLKNIFGIFFIF